MKLVLPKTIPDLAPYKKLPLFFLAGPIQGGGDWHTEMSMLLEEKAGDSIIVNPSRYPEEHPYHKTKLPYAFPGEFPHQTAWERHFMEYAARDWDTGCLIFWLPVESKIFPRTDGLSYAMDTRGELGEWRGRLMLERYIRVVIGAEPDFPGLRTIERNFQAALGGDFEIHRSMEDVANYAVRRATAPQFR